MTRGELCELLIRDARDYKKEGVLKSITRNHHMNEYDGEEIKETAIDAILVDFINYVATHQGLDLGLYIKDLKGERVWIDLDDTFMYPLNREKFR